MRMYISKRAAVIVVIGTVIALLITLVALFLRNSRKQADPSPDSTKAISVNRTVDLLADMTKTKPEVFIAENGASFYWLDVVVMDSKTDIRLLEDGMDFLTNDSREGTLVIKRGYITLNLRAIQRSSIPLDVSDKAHVVAQFRHNILIKATEKNVTDGIVELADRIKIETASGTYVVTW